MALAVIRFPVLDVVFAVTLCAALPDLAKAQTYRWVDANGTVHYSQDPGAAPPGTPVSDDRRAQDLPAANEAAGDRRDTRSQQGDERRITYYEWVDRAGILHSTDDPSQVPDDLRDRVSEREVVVQPQPDVPAKRDSAVWQSEPDEAPAARRAEVRRHQQELVTAYRALYDRFTELATELPRARATGKPPVVLQRILVDLGTVQESLQDLARQLKSLPQRVQADGGNARWVSEWPELNLPEPPQLDL